MNPEPVFSPHSDTRLLHRWILQPASLFSRCRFAYTTQVSLSLYWHKGYAGKKLCLVPPVIPESRAFESSNLYQLLVTSKWCTLKEVGHEN